MRYEKILFLDVDGVLNYVMDQSIDRLIPDRVQLVNEIVRRTGCGVVISSTIRKRTPPVRTSLNELFMKAGATFPVYSYTPFYAEHDDKCRGKGFAHECGRGHEIQEWMDIHNFEGSIAILDDSSDMGHLKDRLIRTSHSTGLLVEHVEAVCALLGEIT